MTRTNPEQSSVAPRESWWTDRSPVAAWACSASRAPSMEARSSRTMRAGRCSPARRGGTPAVHSRTELTGERLLPDDLAPGVELVAWRQGRLDLGRVALHVPAGIGQETRERFPDPRVASFVRFQEMLDHRLAAGGLLLLYDHLRRPDLHLLL